MGNREALRDALLLDIAEEYESASKRYPKFATRHDGYAVILEELDEVWDAIKTNQLNAVLEPELKQVGAMILRFLMDIIYGSSPTKVKEEMKE